MSKTVRANSNIAPIKYWGKKNEEKRIPFTSSVSMTLDAFYSDTSVEYKSDLKEDVFYLDGQKIEGAALQRVQKFMDFVRSEYPEIKDHAIIRSENHVPTAAGLASSASAFAALAKASTLSLDLSNEELSRLARMGSGSASRSIYGDFVKWERGVDHESSYALPIDMEPWDDLRMIAVLVNEEKKAYSSSEAMKLTVDESVYYPAWVEQNEKDVDLAIQYLKEHRLDLLGPLVQANALRMHASLMAVNRWYFEPMTVEVMNRVRRLQEEIPVYFTMDAGPNVKLITEEKHLASVLELIADFDYVVAGPGKGLEVL